MLRFIVIAVLIIVCLVALMQLLVKYDVISDKMRTSLGITSLIVGIGIGIFTWMQDKTQTHLTDLARSFLQGKTLECQVNLQTLDVSQEMFNFISGTLTLMGKDDTEYKQVVIPLKACKEKEL